MYPADMVARSIDLHAEDAVVAVLPSQNTWFIYPREVGYFNQKVKAYRDQFSLSNVSDLAELDRVVMYETLAHRYSTWAGEGKDYWDDEVNESKMMDLNKSISTEIRQIKAALGINKITRDKTTGDDSVASRWADILRRAKEFGVMRNSQFDKALELIAQLDANLTLWANCDDPERKLMGCRQDDIWQWIQETLLPEFRLIDEGFRKTSQRMWVTEINR